MELLNFFKKESNIPLRRLVFFAALAGISNGILLAILNMAAQNVAHQMIELHLFVLYFLAFLVYAYSQRYLMLKMTLNIENMVCSVRLRIAKKIQQVELRYVEHKGREDLYSTLQQQSNFIAQIALQLSIAIGSVFLMSVTLIYLGFISLSSLLMVLAMMGLLLPLHIRNNYRAHQRLTAAGQQQGAMFNNINHILEGFKELKFNQKKTEDIFQHLEVTAQLALDSRLEASQLEITVITFIRLAFLVLLAMLVFVVPAFTPTYAEQIFTIIATMLFILAPLNLTLSSVPIINRANASVTQLYRLETELDLAKEYSSNKQLTYFDNFQEIQLQDIEFEYRNAENELLFSISKINFNMKQGEILFIVGGNGSGKSTLLKVLSGLYSASAGELFVNQHRIDKNNIQAYRELFATVMTDFHLFNRLYGISNIDEQEVQKLLEEMELQHKTKFVNGRFTNIDLSTGQRKRLAFIVAYLEDKPIYMFDEFAADQDPHFRQYFYEVIVQRLKQQGKSVIAVTHDEKYFNCADRVVKMDYGQLMPYDA